MALLQRALLTGRAELRPDSFVSRILVQGGRATGVEWIDAEGERRTSRRPTPSSWPAGPWRPPASSCSPASTTR